MPLNSQKRLRSLVLATNAVLDGSDLTLTKIGRSLDTDTTVKHAIKRIDRLLSNRNLHREKESIYRWHASFITRANPFPVVLVDWSDVREQLDEVNTIICDKDYEKLDRNYANMLSLAFMLMWLPMYC